MKKLFLLLTFTFTFLSCSSDDDMSNTSEVNNYKKIKTIISENSTTTYFYNAKGFISEMNYESDISFNAKFIYQGNRIVQKETSFFSGNIEIEKYYYEGDNIAKSETEHSYVEYFYNEAGQMIKAISIHPYAPVFNNEVVFSYSLDGNLFSQMSSDGYYETFDYDDKINPDFYSIPSSLLKIGRVSKNNITRYGDFHYSYEYDLDEYPIIRYSSGETFVYTYY